MTEAPANAVHSHRSMHLCSTGCGCRSWECAECGTRHLVDRQVRYETEGPGPGQFAVELCDGCGGPLCDQCVSAGGYGMHECPGKPEGTEDDGLLPERFPGVTAHQAAELVRQVRAHGTAAFRHDGQVIQLTPSKIEGSRAIWAKRA